MKKFMKENYLNSNIKLNRFNGFLSVDNVKIIKGEATANEIITEYKKEWGVNA